MSEWRIRVESETIATKMRNLRCPADIGSLGKAGETLAMLVRVVHH
jgi:hypothetical protein